MHVVSWKGGQARTRAHTHMYTHTRTHTHTSMHTHTHAQTHEHTHTCTHTHTDAYTKRKSLYYKVCFTEHKVEAKTIEYGSIFQHA